MKHLSSETELAIFAEQIRIETLKELKARGFGHVGGCMSVVETLAVLYGNEMQYDPLNPKDPDRDWLVISKGHAGPALYATLALCGFFPKELLASLNQNGTSLPSHCDRNLTPGVDMTTGSLGQGMSTALGVALGNKRDGRSSYTYLIIGDGECDEGQIWEGALFAPQFKLDHLILFVDYNKKQLDGTTASVLDLGDIDKKFEAFQWHVQRINGHDIAAIENAIEVAKATENKPSVIVLDTIKGHGCGFAENAAANHHMNMDPALTDAAIALSEEKIRALSEGGIA